MTRGLDVCSVGGTGFKSRVTTIFELCGGAEKAEDSSRTREARFGGMLSGPGWFQKPDS